MTTSLCTCGRPKWSTSQRCHVCAEADRAGEHNPNFRGGPMPAYYYHRKTIERHPDEARARAIARAALRKGVIHSEPCKVCGEAIVQMHHEDYSEPLNVTWLCKVHHREIHQGMGWAGIRKEMRPKPQEVRA